MEQTDLDVLAGMGARLTELRKLVKYETKHFEDTANLIKTTATTTSNLSKVVTQNNLKKV